MAQNKQMSLSRTIRKTEAFYSLSEMTLEALQYPTTGSLLPLTAAAMDALKLPSKCLAHVKQWWIGSLTGKKCAENCVTEIVKFGTKFGGVVAGVGMGAIFLGPVAAVFLGMASGYFGGKVGKSLVNQMFNFLFGHKKKSAVENAYNFLGVSRDSSNEIISKAFKEKALKYHPDKKGKSEKFHRLQRCMALIRMDRESNGYYHQENSKEVQAICQ